MFNKNQVKILNEIDEDHFIFQVNRKYKKKLSVLEKFFSLAHGSSKHYQTSRSFLLY
jgi:hypothetical protein